MQGGRFKVFGCFWNFRSPMNEDEDFQISGFCSSARFLEKLPLV